MSKKVKKYNMTFTYKELDTILYRLYKYNEFYSACDECETRIDDIKTNTECDNCKKKLYELKIDNRIKKRLQKIGTKVIMDFIDEQLNNL